MPTTALPYTKRKMDGAGVGPGDIRSLDDLRRLPFTTSKDLQEGYPFPLLSVPVEKVVRIHASSGTTGKTQGPLLQPEGYSGLGPFFRPLLRDGRAHPRRQGPDRRGVRGLDRRRGVSAGLRDLRCHGRPGGPGQHGHAVRVSRRFSEHGHVLHGLHGPFSWPRRSTGAGSATRSTSRR